MEQLLVVVGIFALSGAVASSFVGIGWVILSIKDHEESIEYKGKSISDLQDQHWKLAEKVGNLTSEVGTLKGRLNTLTKADKQGAEQSNQQTGTSGL